MRFCKKKQKTREKTDSRKVFFTFRSEMGQKGNVTAEN